MVKKLIDTLKSLNDLYLDGKIICNDAKVLNNLSELSKDLEHIYDRVDFPLQKEMNHDLYIAVKNFIHFYELHCVGRLYDNEFQKAYNKVQLAIKYYDPKRPDDRSKDTFDYKSAYNELNQAATDFISCQYSYPFSSTNREEKYKFLEHIVCRNLKNKEGISIADYTKFHQNPLNYLNL